jgi:hypothetical protein
MFCVSLAFCTSSSSIPVAPYWSIGHPWKFWFNFTFVILDSRKDSLDGGSVLFWDVLDSYWRYRIFLKGNIELIFFCWFHEETNFNFIFLERNPQKTRCDIYATPYSVRCLHWLLFTETSKLFSALGRTSISLCYVAVDSSLPSSLLTSSIVYIITARMHVA